MSSKPSLRVLPSKPQVCLGQQCNENTLAPVSEVPGTASAAVTSGAFSRHIRHKHFMITSYDTLCMKITSTHGSFDSIAAFALKFPARTQNAPSDTKQVQEYQKNFPLDSLVLNCSSIYLLETFSTDHSVSHDSYPFNLAEIIVRTKRCQNQLQLSKCNLEELSILD